MNVIFNSFKIECTSNITINDHMYRSTSVQVPK